MIVSSASSTYAVFEFERKSSGAESAILMIEELEDGAIFVRPMAEVSLDWSSVEFVVFVSGLIIDSTSSSTAVVCLCLLSSTAFAG